MNKKIILLLLMCALPIVAGSDGENSRQNDENITQIVSEGNNLPQVPQTMLDQFLDLMKGEDGYAIFWGGFGAFMGMLYMAGKLT